MPSPNTSVWNIDPTHSAVEFAVRHLMIATVRGRFADVTGVVEMNDSDAALSKVDVTIQAASIDTRQEQRDAHLRSADFFDVAQFPTLRFVGKQIRGDVNGDFTLLGDLTIRGVTREVTLDVTNEGRVQDPWGNARAGFTAKGKIARSEFGLTWNQVLEAGGVAVGDEIKISIDVELVKASVESAKAA